jgi:hypothetical protein
MTGGPRFCLLRAKAMRYRASVCGKAAGRTKRSTLVLSVSCASKASDWGSTDAMGKRGHVGATTAGPWSVVVGSNIAPMQWCCPLRRQHAGRVVAELNGKNDAMSGKPIRNATASAIILRILSQRIRESARERQIGCRIF